MVDTLADPPCPTAKIVGGSIAACGSRRAQYSHSRGVARKECLTCGRRTALDTAPDVARKVKTLEQWREWWRRIGENP
jgi:hypothetical protein